MPMVTAPLGTTMENSFQIPVMKGWREGRITGGSDLEPKCDDFNHKLKCPNLVNTYLDTYLGNEFTRIIHIDIFMV